MALKSAEHAFEIGSIRESYIDIVELILTKGADVAPRGQPTKEIRGITLITEDLADNMPIGTGRKCKPAIGAVEAIQLIAGYSDPELTCHVAPNMKQFMDDGRFHGAYGERSCYQLPGIIRRLRKDADTRQAVVTLWHPDLDLLAQKHDYPCTVMFHWMIRDGRLEMHQYMRSNDVWWGLAYDVFQFTQLQLTIARCLGILPGRNFHHVGSLHMYSRDWGRAADLHPPTGDKLRLTGIGTDRMFSSGDWHDFQDRALAIIRGERRQSYTVTEQWYDEQLDPYRE